MDFSLWVEVAGIHIPSILGQGAGSVPTHGAPLHDFLSTRVMLTSLSVECTKEVKGLLFLSWKEVPRARVRVI